MAFAGKMGEDGFGVGFVLGFVEAMMMEFAGAVRLTSVPLASAMNAACFAGVRRMPAFLSASSNARSSTWLSCTVKGTESMDSSSFLRGELDANMICCIKTVLSIKNVYG